MLQEVNNGRYSQVAVWTATVWKFLPQQRVPQWLIRVQCVVVRPINLDSYVSVTSHNGNVH